MGVVEARYRNTRTLGETNPDQTGLTKNDLHSDAVIARKDIGNDLSSSRGGTPWIGRIGSKILPANKWLGSGLNRFRNDPRPFNGDVMVNRRSQSVQDLAPQNTLDYLVSKNKKPWWDSGNQVLPVNIGNWTDSGPQRPSLRLKTFTWRKGSQGNRNYGLHTNIDFSPRTLPGRDTMVPGRQDRLTVARYRGQSFSATTEVLGA